MSEQKHGERQHCVHKTVIYQPVDSKSAFGDSAARKMEMEPQRMNACELFKLKQNRYEILPVCRMQSKDV